MDIIVGKGTPVLFEKIRVTLPPRDNTWTWERALKNPETVEADVRSPVDHVYIQTYPSRLKTKVIYTKYKNQKLKIKIAYLGECSVIITPVMFT